jgi:hypothetical protein
MRRSCAQPIPLLFEFTSYFARDDSEAHTRRLQFLGTGITDYQDYQDSLVARGHKQPFVGAISAYLRESSGVAANRPK